MHTAATGRVWPRGLIPVPIARAHRHAAPLEALNTARVRVINQLRLNINALCPVIR